MKLFPDSFREKHEKAFPTLIKSNVAVKKHKQGCGCFINPAVANFQTCIKGVGTDHRLFAIHMKCLDKYHTHDLTFMYGKMAVAIFTLSGFVLASDVTKAVNFGVWELNITTRNVLYCLVICLHSEIKCSERANLAEHFIHSKLGKVVSNLTEDSHNVLTRFRSKDLTIALWVSISVR